MSTSSQRLRPVLVRPSTTSQAAPVSDIRWHRLHELASRQRGLVSTSQLAGLGFDKDTIYRLTRRGLLGRHHRGVYSVGHEQRTFISRCWAARLAVGADSVLSHLTAAYLLGLVEREPRVIDLSVFRQHRRSRAGIRVHALGRSGTESRRIHGGLTVTSPSWTVIDSGPQLGPAALRQAVRTAMVKHDMSLNRLRQSIEAHRPDGAAALRRAIDAVDDPGMHRTRGELERRFLTFVIASGLPRPNVNVPLRGYEVDFLWFRERLVVETDDRLGHAGTDQQLRDVRRDAALEGAGYRVIRVTSTDLSARSGVLLARLRAALGIDDASSRTKPAPSAKRVR